MEPQTPVSQSIEPQNVGRGLRKIATVIVVIIIIGLGGFYYYSSNSSPKITVDYMRTRMLQGSTLSFDERNIAIIDSTSNLSDDIRTLIPDNATNVQVGQSQSGVYKIRFDVSQNMHDYYFEFRKASIISGWKYLSGGRSDLINIIELENDSYTLRSEIVFVTSEKVTRENMEQISEQSEQSLVTILVKTK